MTQKSRSKKFKKTLKRKKSNDRPLPLSDPPVVTEDTRIISEARFRSVALVTEGEGFPGASIEVVVRTPEEQLLFDEFGIDLTKDD